MGQLPSYNSQDPELPMGRAHSEKISLILRFLSIIEVVEDSKYEYIYHGGVCWPLEAQTANIFEYVSYLLCRKAMKREFT